jgi:hypothetical protein
MRLILAALCLAAAPALADPNLAGEYHGTIRSGGRDEPGITVLTVSRDGTIQGRYDFVDLGTVATGTLDRCLFAAPILTCQWTDRYGSGAWVVEVASDFAEFRGSWYDDSLPLPHKAPDQGYLWTGRKRAAPPQS